MPITQLWNDQGWMSKFPQALIDMITIQGELYCVPLNIHRGNVLWYNKQVFSDLALTPPTTFAEFFTVAEALETAGKIPLALGEGWTASQLMEGVLLSELGPTKYRGLWNGAIPFNGPDVKAALATFDQIMEYVNPDHSSTSLEQTAGLLGKGDAGMTINGDWMEYLLESSGFTPDVDFGWVPVPGTEGEFMVVTDTFTMPRNAPHPINATDWLTTIASLEAQETFAPFKGTIPARLDADPSLFGPYYQGAMADYLADELVPTFVHGIAAPPVFVNATLEIIYGFIENGDIDRTADAWQLAACEAGFGTCFVYLPVIVK